MFCPNCGNQLADGAQFCNKCGTRLGGADPSNTAAAGAASSSAGYAQTTASPVMPQQAPQNAWNNGPIQQGSYTPKSPVKTDRSLIAYIVLSIVTCGIYGYWFVYSIARDLNMMCEGDGEKTGGLVAYILLSFFTCGIYNIWWLYKIGNRLQRNAPRYGLMMQENGTTILMWYIFGIVLCGIGPWIGMHIVIKNTNALATAYNARTFGGNGLNY